VRLAKRLEHDKMSFESRGDAVPHGATLEVVRIAAVAVVAGVAIDTKGRIAGVDQSYDRERAWNRLAAKLP
jgi:hypothetical protein